MQIEKRKIPRFTTSVPVGLRFSKGNEKEGWGRILNLSPEGILLETRFRLKVAHVIYVSFALKDGAKFDNLRARVIRVKYEEGYFLGAVAFDDIVDKQTLGDVISALAYEGGIRVS